MARRSYLDIYIHLVWRTRYNRPILKGPLEQFVHSRLREIAEDLDATPIAVNSAWNHVHGLFQWNASLSIADVVREMKSRTAVEWNRRDSPNGPTLRWQAGYGAVATRRRYVTRVTEYIRNQKHHHRTNDLFDELERTQFPVAR